MANFLDALKEKTNFSITENGALTHKSTGSKVYDLFAMGGAYRSRSEEDCVVLFMNAFKEDPVYALKCLFYLRDVRGGQGERRFFRVCMRHLAKKNAEAARRNLKYIAEFGRWDDLFTFIGTPLEKDALEVIRNQLAIDVECKTPSLLAKWLKSENTSSTESRYIAGITRKYLHMTHKQYRKTLSILRERINVLERLMSAGKWDEIEFDKIPSKAGMIYKNAFARKDIIKAKYEAFAKDENTKVNAGTLYPCEVVHQATEYLSHYGGNETDRAMINKYWDNLTDYFNGASFNALAVVDTSGSMTWGGAGILPIDVAISLGLYCADKANGPFAGHYISFSSRPQLIEVEGVDFVDKVCRIYETNLCENTNIKATFDLILGTAIKHKILAEDMPENLIIISDMEFDAATGYWGENDFIGTLMEDIEFSWAAAGYKMPKLVFWNVNARNNNIPMKDKNGITFVSGYSPVLFEQIMSGKTAQDLMYDKLNSERYACIK